MTEQLQRHQQQIKELINEIKKMVLISENDIKTLVYWAIATHAHEDLDRFPVLRITGDSETGKSDLTKIARDLSRQPNEFQDIKSWSEAGIRETIAAHYVWKGSCFFDEADNFPDKFYEHLFDKALSKFRDMGNKSKGEFAERDEDLYIPICMNGRDSLDDVSRINRTIEIFTVKDPNGAPDGYLQFQFQPYNSLCKVVAIGAKLRNVKTNHGQRIKQCWATLQAVAEYLADEEFLLYVAQVFQDHKTKQEEQRSGELVPKTWNAIVEICHIYVVEGELLSPTDRPYVKWKGEFPTHLKLKKIAEQAGKTNDDGRSVGRAVEQLGLPKKKSGSMVVHDLSARRLKEIGDKYGFHDDWLNEQAEKEGLNQKNQNGVLVTTKN